MATILHDSTTTQGATSLGRRVDWRWGLLASWVAGGALFLARAIAGRFSHPLSSIGLIAVAAIAVVVALELRALLRGNFSTRVTAPKTTQEWLAQHLPTLGVILLATGFSVAGAYPTGMVLLWVIAAGEALFGAGGPWTLPLVQRLLKREQTDRGTTILDHPRGTVKPKPVAPVKASEALAEPLISDLDAVEETELDAELPWLWQEATAVQELRYMTLPEQGLCITGSQRVTLAATQQTAVVHTVFHPPFEAVPVVMIVKQEPETVGIKAAQILPHGIRWELRTASSPEQPQQVQWAFSVTTRDPRG